MGVTDLTRNAKTSGAAERPSYFQAYGGNLNLWAVAAGQQALRECQIAAYWATWAHFTSTDEPALVSLPTGAGKTALMMILALGMKAKRCLIVTPSELLRDQIAKSFESLQDLKDLGVVPNTLSNLSVRSNDTVLGSTLEWSSLTTFDVVVATPKTVSPLEKGVAKPPQGLFDLVFIDEGHHEPAPTYRAIVQEFASAKRVLLTGTPYRRDRRALGAPLIYHYPIGRAVDAGIYEPVDYVPVTATQKTRSSRDATLRDEAVRIFRSERKKGNKSLLFIRTDSIERAEHLEKIYRDDAGLNIARVDYDQDFTHNVGTLDALRKGELDGVVCIGMMGEGIDIPTLKIAVLHAPPRSLPLTVQIIGRLARKTVKRTKAFLVASDREARGALAQLYRNGADWSKLIPKLAKEAIKQQADPISVSSNVLYGALDLDPNLLRPFFSVRVFNAKDQDPDYNATVLFRDKGASIAANFDYLNHALRVFLVEVEAAPTWARDSGLVESRFELTLFYQKSGYVFELSTNARLGRDIRTTVFGELASPKPETILKASAPLVLDYYTIGLRNALGSSNSQPSYKMLMGSQTQTAVRSIDSLAFTGGHAIMRVDSDEVRGVALDSKRVWSMKRGALDEFAGWCDDIAGDLSSKKAYETLPGLDVLAPVDAPIITERPLAALVDDSILRASRNIVVTDATAGDKEVKIVPFIKILSFSGTTNTVHCAVVFGDADEDNVLVDRTQDGKWHCTDTRNIKFRLEWSEDDHFDGDLEDYLTAYPPSIVLASGGVVNGDRLLRFKQRSNVTLPEQMTPELDWHGCDITVERENPKRNIFPKTGMVTVQKHVETLLKAKYKGGVIVFDDGTGEVADFILIEPSEKLIAFYHCKGSERANPGTRVGDAYEVFGQACRSAIWVRSSNLMEHLKRQVEERADSNFLQGSITEEMSEGFRSGSWTYRIVVVQPGFDLNKLGTNPKTAPLVSSVCDYILPIEAEFEIWGQRKAAKLPKKRTRKAN